MCFYQWEFSLFVVCTIVMYGDQDVVKMAILILLKMSEM